MPFPLLVVKAFGCDHFVRWNEWRQDGTRPDPCLPKAAASAVTGLLVALAEPPLLFDQQQPAPVSAHPNVAVPIVSGDIPACVGLTHCFGVVVEREIRGQRLHSGLRENLIVEQLDLGKLFLEFREIPLDALSVYGNSRALKAQPQPSSHDEDKLLHKASLQR